MIETVVVSNDVDVIETSKYDSLTKDLICGQREKDALKEVREGERDGERERDGARERETKRERYLFNRLGVFHPDLLDRISKAINLVPSLS